MKVKTLKNTGISAETTIPDALFAAPVNQQLLAQAVHVYRSNTRQGTSATKTRSAIRLTTKKWFKQKGTGNARHGAKSSNIFVGGGVSHGPTGQENWSKQLSKTQKKSALISALSLQVGNMFVCDQLDELTGKTKEAAAMLAPVIGDAQRILVVLHESPEQSLLALSNLAGVRVVPAYQLSTLDVIYAHVIVMTSKAVAELEQRLTNKTKRTSVASVKETAHE